MLKKAGIVVLGATAGMLSLAPLASAGETPQTGHHHGHHQEHDRDGGGRGGCNEFAGSSGDRLLSLDNVASNLDISRVNVLASDESVNGGGCGGGGRGGNSTAISQGDRLISADNLLANADVSRVNVLAKDASVNF